MIRLMRHGHWELSRHVRQQVTSSKSGVLQFHSTLSSSINFLKRVGQGRDVSSKVCAQMTTTGNKRVLVVRVVSNNYAPSQSEAKMSLSTTTTW